MLSKDIFTYIEKINSILKGINSNSGSESFLSATSKTISGIRKYSTLSPIGRKNTMFVESDIDRKVFDRTGGTISSQLFMLLTPPLGSSSRFYLCASPLLLHRTTQVVGGGGGLLKGFTNMVNLTPGLSKIKPIRGVRPFSTSPFVSNPYSPARNNKFLMDMDRKCKDKYQNLPAFARAQRALERISPAPQGDAKSILKHPDSFISNRIILSDLEVLALYNLNSECKDIQELFTVQEKLDIPGIYCYMSKDRENLAHYIGSSTNMKRRYNRHQSNLNSKEASGA